MKGASGPVLPVRRTTEQARRLYDRLSGLYDLLVGPFEGPHREAGLRLLAPAAGEVMLEIGCGAGHALLATALAVGPTGHVYGIDISPRMLEITRKRLIHAGVAGRALLLHGDARRLPVGQGQLDGVFMSFTLELFDTPDIPVVLGECLRALRPGGRLCVVSLSRCEKPTLMTRLYEWLHQRFPQYCDCRPIYVCQAIESAGFQPSHVRQSSLLGLRIETVLALKKL